MAVRTHSMGVRTHTICSMNSDTTLCIFFHDEMAHRFFWALSFESLMNQLQTGYLTSILDKKLKSGDTKNL